MIKSNSLYNTVLSKCEFHIQSAMNIQSADDIFLVYLSTRQLYLKRCKAWWKTENNEVLGDRLPNVI